MFLKDQDVRPISQIEAGSGVISMVNIAFDPPYSIKKVRSILRRFRECRLNMVQAEASGEDIPQFFIVKDGLCIAQSHNLDEVMETRQRPP